MDAYRSGCGPCEVLWVKKTKPVSSGSQKGPQSVPIRSPEYRDWAVAWIKFRLFSGLTSVKFVCSCDQWLSHTQRSFWPSKLQCGWFMNSSWTFHKKIPKLQIFTKWSWSVHEILLKILWLFNEKFFLLKFLSTMSCCVSKASRTFEKISNLSKCLPLVVLFDLCARNSPFHWLQTWLTFNLSLFVGCNVIPSNAKNRVLS